MNEVIQEYLVSLGFDVDNNTYSKFQGALNASDTLVEKFGMTTVASFAKAGIGVVAFVAAATVGMAKFMKGLAESDMEVQKFARTMWMGVDNARALKNTLDVMGQSLEDIALNPELRRQFQELRTQAFQMEAPEEYKQYMQDMRAIMFEVKRLQLEMKYASQWVGYYLYEYLEKPLASFHMSLADLNKYLVKNMPVWTKYIAQGLSFVARGFIVIIRVISDLIGMFDDLPGPIRIAIGVLAAFIALFSLSPVGLFMLAIAALILVLDDFYTWLDGGEGHFIDWGNGIDQVTRTVKLISDSITNASNAVKQLIDDFKALFTFFDTGKVKDSKLWELGFRALEVYGGWRQDQAKDGLNSGGASGGLGGNGPTSYNTTPSFALPKGDVSNVSNDVKINTTFNQYGSDPASTSSAVMKYMDQLLIRNLKGVMG